MACCLPRKSCLRAPDKGHVVSEEKRRLKSEPKWCRKDRTGKSPLCAARLNFTSVPHAQEHDKHSASIR
eukprot:scaffold180560_cov22-Tisochrysis_lutea.AAC.1